MYIIEQKTILFIKDKYSIHFDLSTNKSTKKTEKVNVNVSAINVNIMPKIGFEPMANDLSSHYSTAELFWRIKI